MGNETEHYQKGIKKGTVNRGMQCRGKAREGRGGARGAGRGGRGGCGAELLAALHTFGQNVRAQGNRDEFTGAVSRGLRRRARHGGWWFRGRRCRAMS